MEIEAHALDGTGTVTILKGPVGPDTVTMDAEFHPDREYMLSIHAHGKWDLYFVRAQQDPGTTDHKNP